MGFSTKLSMLFVESLQDCNFATIMTECRTSRFDESLRGFQNAPEILALGFQPQACQKISPPFAKRQEKLKKTK
jgi:hypothetical protein